MEDIITIEIFSITLDKMPFFSLSRMSRMERDITMKRHLIEDLKFRQKVNLESNESINEMLGNLEKKVSIFMFTDTRKKRSLPFVFTFLTSIFNLNKMCSKYS